jgi:hypothetical protein
MWAAWMISGSQKELIVSFMMSDSIIILKNDKIKKYLAKSQYITVPYMYKINVSDFGYVKGYEPGKYSVIRYDRYRNLYYRIVDHSFMNKQDDTRVTKFYEKPWSFIILDENFNHIEEIAFTGEECLTGFSIMPQGLLFTKHISGGLFEEDTQQYILHKIVLE